MSESSPIKAKKDRPTELSKNSGLKNREDQVIGESSKSDRDSFIERESITKADHDSVKCENNQKQDSIRQSSSTNKNYKSLEESNKSEQGNVQNEKQISVDAAQVGSGTKCDRIDSFKTGTDNSSKILQTRLEASPNQNQIVNKSKNKENPSVSRSTKYQLIEEKLYGKGVEDEEEEDDDNQVIPLWPSKSEALQKNIGSRNSTPVQHKVYSLKDYSQVASPTALAGDHKFSVDHGSKSKISTNAGNRLLKSMSQDRKIRVNTKRLSECLYLSSAGPHLMSLQSAADDTSQSTFKPSFSDIKSKKSSKKHSTHQDSSPSMVHLGGGVIDNSPQLMLSGESRIDRVRKLFVSPLSLRSNSGATENLNFRTKNQRPVVEHPAPSFQQRLSFQSGTSMLNKPHHIMHAMSRQTGGGHHSGTKKSPSRFKQAKSFKVYGCPLHMANNIYPITCFGRADIYKQQSVPYILARLCNYIEENSSHLTHEGIFRVSGNARLMEKLRTLFDHLGDAPLESESVDVATSASMLKMYLRELPEPLIPTRMNYYFIALAKKYAPHLAKDWSIGVSGMTKARSAMDSHQSIKSSHASTIMNPFMTESISHSDQSSGNNNDERVRLAFMRDLTKLVRKLPIENYNLLKYLACFLYRISLKQEFNKMCAEALGIVFGPNVFRIRSESYKGLKEQELSNQIMASIIRNYKLIFDSELTDPLGNLIDTNTGSIESTKLIHPDTDDTNLNPVASVSDGSDVFMQLTSLTPSDAASNLSIDPMPASCSDNRQERGIPSLIDGNRNDIDDPSGMVHKPCCGQYCKSEIYSSVNHHHGNDSDCEGLNETGFDDIHADDNDDIADDDESYTPTTGSVSYCSSVDTDSDGSTSYDDEFDRHQHDHDHHHHYHRKVHHDRDNTNEHVDEDDRYGHLDSNLQSSKSDQDDNEHASFSECGSDTSYTASLSQSVDLEDPEDENDDENEDNQLACGRRNSSSFDESSPSEVVGKHTAGASGNDWRRQVHRRHRQRRIHHGRSSSNCRVCHRRQVSRHKLMAESKVNSQGAFGPANLTQSTSDFKQRQEAEIVIEGSIQDRNDEQDKRHVLVEIPAQDLPRRSRQASVSDRRFDYLRRRSSSASSLHRIRLAASLRPSRASEHHTDLNGQFDRNPILKATPSRNKANSKRTGATTLHGHSIRRRHDKVNSPALRKAVRDHQRAGSRHNRRFPDDSIQVKRTSRLSDPRDESLIINSDQVGRRPGVESYYLLRSFNSDDTLMRPFNGTNLPFPEEALTGRRLSGNEPGKSAIIEEDSASNKLVDDDMLHKGRTKTQSFGASSISLLDSSINKINDSFRRSDISIFTESNGPKYNSSCDPVIIQMRALKDLVKNLRKLSFLGSTRGYTAGMESLIKSIASRGDSIAGERCLENTLYLVDYLAAIDLRDAIDQFLFGNESNLREPTDPDLLDTMLRDIMKELARRYRDLKNLRDHFIHYHAHKNTAQPSRHESNIDNKSRSSENSVHEIFAMSDSEEAYDIGLSGGHRRVSLSKTFKEKDHSSTGSDPSINTIRQDKAAHRSKDRSKSGPGSVGRADSQSAEDITCGSKLFEHQDPPKERICRFGSLCPVEFVFNIERQLAFKRTQGSRMDVKLSDMNIDQLMGEKLDLQKNLLRYEHWFGRPSSRMEFSFIGHVYERYRAVKSIKQVMMREYSSLSSGRDVQESILETANETK